MHFSIFAICLAAAVSGVAVTGRSLQAEAPQAIESGPVYLPRPEYLRWMSLGYDNVLADVLWFRTISYFGKHYRSDRTYPWLAYMCDLVTDLDPRAAHVYRFAGMVLPWEAGQAKDGLRLLIKATKVFPNSWLYPYWTGFIYYFFENDYKTAAEWMSRAAQLPGANPIAARLAALFAAHRYGPDATIDFLRELETEVNTEEMREVIRKNIREAKLAAQIDKLNQAVSLYRGRYGSIPPDLQELVRVHILERVPTDPFGGRYVIDGASGKVKSSTGHEPLQLYQSNLRKKILRGERVEPPGS
jgi:tetratricopeptide (TPR) repeat protein